MKILGVICPHPPHHAATIGTNTGGNIAIFRAEENALTGTAGDPIDLVIRIRSLAGDCLRARRLATTANWQSSPLPSSSVP